LLEEGRLGRKKKKKQKKRAGRRRKMYVQIQNHTCTHTHTHIQRTQQCPRVESRKMEPSEKNKRLCDRCKSGTGEEWNDEVKVDVDVDVI
jgi:TPP-dependent indolepyruvate ferredoxin oxidoreductase alpha subunit